MATCKDCVHVDVCCSYLSTVYNKCKLATPDFELLMNIECDECQHFKDRSRFVELSHAEWVEDEDMYGDPIYHCSNCNEHFVLEEGTPTDNCYFYCPNCGAKMDKQALKERES